MSVFCYADDRCAAAVTEFDEAISLQQVSRNSSSNAMKEAPRQPHHVFSFRPTVHVNDAEPTRGFCPGSWHRWPSSSLRNLCIAGPPIIIFYLGDFALTEKQ